MEELLTDSQMANRCLPFVFWKWKQKEHCSQMCLSKKWLDKCAGRLSFLFFRSLVSKTVLKSYKEATATSICEDLLWNLIFLRILREIFRLPLSLFSKSCNCVKIHKKKFGWNSPLALSLFKKKFSWVAKSLERFFSLFLMLVANFFWNSIRPLRTLGAQFNAHVNGTWGNFNTLQNWLSLLSSL